MVLKPPPPFHRESRGITLVELVISTAMAGLVVTMALALYKDVSGAARLSDKRTRGDFRAQAVFSALARNLMAGTGVIELSENSVSLFNQRGRRVEYRWEDSTLTINGSAQDFRLGGLLLEAGGPQIPLGPDGLPSADLPPALDSLDGNRDGIIDFDELDRDHDRTLDIYECRYLSQIRVSMTTVLGDVPTVRSVLIHPRNHARDSVGVLEDVSGEANPFL